MEKLRCRRQKECREIQRNIERRHLKSVPSDPDGQRKTRSETEWARSGQVNHAARIPLTRVDGCLKFYRNRTRFLSQRPAHSRNVIAQIVRPSVEYP